MKHEALAVKHDADPLRAAIDNRVGNLLYSLAPAAPVTRKLTNFDLLHMPLSTPITEFTAYGEIVEVASALELFDDLP